MSISDVASLLGGAALGAPVSEIFKLIIAEARKVNDFKPLSQDLASTMESLVPICEEIDKMQGGWSSGNDELKVLIKRAVELVSKCSRVEWYSFTKKASYTRKIKGMNQDFFKFCQINLQLIQHMNLLQSMRSISTVSTKIDLLSDTGKKISELSMVPHPETVTIFWLIRPMMELKKKLFEDGVVSVVVTAPSPCGKTTLVTKLCHDAEVRGKFKQIFFITVSKAPNVRLTVQRLLEHTGCQSNEIANNLDAGLCIQELLKKLGKNGSILLVLDDVWHEEESLLVKFLIKLPDYKILVTSRFEFPSFGPTFHLEPLIDEDVKNLFRECTPEPNCQSCSKHVHNLQKILKRCNGLPLAMNAPRSVCYRMSTRMIEEEKRRAKAMEEEEKRRAKAMEEEKKMRTRMIEEERRRIRMMEADAQIANGFLYEDREDEQVKNDEQIAAVYQECLNNMVDSPPRRTEIKNISAIALLDEDKQLEKVIREEFSCEEEEERRRTKMIEEEERRRTRAIEEERRRTRAIEEERRQINNNAALEEEQVAKAIKKSLKVKGKGKQFEDEQVKNDKKIAAILNNMLDSPPRLTDKNRSSLDEDEQLDKVIRKSLKGKDLIEQSKDDEVEDDGNLSMVNPPRSMCGGCNSEIEHGRSVDVLGVLWHPQCLWCDACDKSIAIHEIETHVSNSRGKFHRSCYQRYCYVCKEKVKVSMLYRHPFWKESYCRAHESDGTPKCCSCQRLEPKGTNFEMLSDRRHLCLECMDSAAIDIVECNSLVFEMREYFEGLAMKIGREFPLLLVEKQALDAAEEEEIDNHYHTSQV